MYSVYACTLYMLLCHSGSGVLVLTTTEVDKTGASYYGEQGLHYLSAKGEGNIVLLGTCIYDTCMYMYAAWYVCVSIGRIDDVRAGCISQWSYDV